MKQCKKCGGSLRCQFVSTFPGESEYLLCWRCDVCDAFYYEEPTKERLGALK